ARAPPPQGCEETRAPPSACFPGYPPPPPSHTHMHSANIHAHTHSHTHTHKSYTHTHPAIRNPFIALWFPCSAHVALYTHNHHQPPQPSEIHLLDSGSPVVPMLRSNHMECYFVRTFLGICFVPFFI